MRSIFKGIKYLSRNDGLSRRRRIRPTSFASCMPSRRESGVLNVFQYAPLPYVLVGILADYGVYEALGICIVFNLGSMQRKGLVLLKPTLYA